MKRNVLLSLFPFLLLLLIGVGCGGGGAAPAGNNQVHMATHVFVVQSITINKGESVTLVNDSGLSHIMLNGSWVNGQAVPAQEAGAPTVNTGQVGAGQSVVIGPFNTAGTFNIYCSLHVNMNLTVVVV